MFSCGLVHPYAQGALALWKELFWLSGKFTSEPAMIPVDLKCVKMAGGQFCEAYDLQCSSGYLLLYFLKKLKD